MDVINISPSTKEEAALFAQKLIADVQGGTVNPLALAVKMNAIIKSLEAVKSAINEQIMDEAYKYSSKGFEAYGAEINIMELGAKYDYSSCGDKAWEMYDQAVSSATESRKSREAFLKALKEPLPTYDPETGETYNINPPIKKSTTGIKISLK